MQITFDVRASNFFLPSIDSFVSCSSRETREEMFIPWPLSAFSDRLANESSQPKRSCNELRYSSTRFCMVVLSSSTCDTFSIHKNELAKSIIRYILNLVTSWFSFSRFSRTSTTKGTDSGAVPINFKSFLSTSFAIKMSADDLSMSAKIDQHEISSTVCRSYKILIILNLTFKAFEHLTKCK